MSENEIVNIFYNQKYKNTYQKQVMMVRINTHDHPAAAAAWSPPHMVISSQSH